jgi:thioredoxin 1
MNTKTRQGRIRYCHSLMRLDNREKVKRFVSMWSTRQPFVRWTRDPRQVVEEGRIVSFDNNYDKPEPSRSEIDSLSGPLLLEFGASWCGYCQALQGPLESLLQSYPHVRHIKVADGKGKPLGRLFGVKLWPNLVFLRDGQIVKQLARPEIDDVRRGLEELAGGV